MTTAVHFHPRAALGLGAPVLARLALRTPQQFRPQKMGFTWHHTGADGTLYKPDPIARLQGIWRYHVETRGYGDIAYAGAFDADGNTYELRDSKYVGAHATSTGNIANVLTDGICFLEDARGITAGALAAFGWWIDLYRFVIGRQPGTFAHRWWAEGHGGTSTECPGDDWDRVIGFVGGHF